MFTLNPFDQREGFQSVARGADTYFDFIETSCRYPIVIPEFDAAGALTNPDQLVPHEIKVMPDSLTVYTEDWEYRKYEALNRECRLPSENSFFVYAFNKEGKLIRPWVDKPGAAPGSVAVCPYEISTFVQYWNPRRVQLPNAASETPLLVGHDLDAIGEYNRSAPFVNPPHALMVRGISAGQFSISVHARLSSVIYSPDKKAQTRDVSVTCTVNVLEDFEKVDALGLFPSVPGKLFGDGNDGRNATLTLKAGETVELRAVAVKHKMEWLGTKYGPGKRHLTTFKELGWTFVPFNDAGAESCAIESINGSGSMVKVSGLKAQEKMVGTLKVYGLGKVWMLTVRVI